MPPRADLSCSPETQHDVHPGLIPAKDQVLVYAAQINLSYQNFEKNVQSRLGGGRGNAAVSALTEDAREVWQAYAFISPGGAGVSPGTAPQHGQGFGVWSALTYLDNKATTEHRVLDMNEILTDASLHRTDAVRIAKARAVEAAFVGYYVDLANKGAP